MDIRRRVMEAMHDERRENKDRSVRYGMSANKLAKLAKLPSRTVYDFVEGKSINLDALGTLMDVLGLTIESTWKIRYLEGEVEKLREEIERLQALVPNRPEWGEVSKSPSPA